ncbi:MAG: hypothetical protein RRA92_07780 [Gemmatimonadota bacterium]|nr:hypothetical protein [Gemmatimonadota bacterium]
MNSRAIVSAAGLRALLVPLALGLGACTEYEITSTVGADGAGTRIEVVRVTPGEADTAVSPADYVHLLGLDASRGWRHRTEGDDDTTHVWERERTLVAAGDWSDLSGSVVLRGTTPAHAADRIGRLRLGDVSFANEVDLLLVRSPSGDTLAWQESFAWTNGAGALVEHFTEVLGAAIARVHPRLSAEPRAEIAGLIRAGFWAAFEEGLLTPESGTDDDALIEAFVVRTARLAADAIRETDPAVDAVRLAEILRRELDDDEALETFLETTLPGLNLAGAVGIELRLVLPGRVLDSNAGDVRGDTLVWEVDPSEALVTPVRTWATAVVGGG